MLLQNSERRLQPSGWLALQRQHWVETILAAAVLIGVIYCAGHIAAYGYLPPPFFYEPSDTFADWFNPAFWARQEGAYDTWGTVYLPVTFVILRLAGLDYCYPSVRGMDPSPGLAARDCDWLGLAAMGAIMLLNLVLTWRAMRKINPATAPMRTICLVLGAPMLNGLERGNMILLAYTCLLLAFGPLLRSAKLRWFFAGLAVNLKIYLIGCLIAPLLKRRWRWVEGALIATVLVYVVSLGIFGAGTPMQIFHNIAFFSGQGAGQILDQWYTTTYRPLISLFETGNFPLSSIIGSLWVERLHFVLPLMAHATQALILCAAAAIWFRPEAYSASRGIALAMLATVVTSEPGGYTMMCVSLFVLMEPWRGWGCKIAIILCYVLAIPADVPIDTLPETVGSLYFSDATTMVARHVTLGPFLRPLLIMVIAWALSMQTLSKLWNVWKEERGLPMPVATSGWRRI